MRNSASSSAGMLVRQWFSEMISRVFGTRPFVCDDCVRHESCGQPPDPECITRAMQLESLEIQQNRSASIFPSR